MATPFSFFRETIMCKLLTFIIAIFFTVSLLHGSEPKAEAINSEALFIAAKEGNPKKVDSLLANGAPVDAKQAPDGLTPLIIAIQWGHLPVVQALMKAGADVNLKDDLNQATPLMWAVRKGDKKPMRLTATIEQKYPIADFLLETGADVNARNRWGGTAIQWAADSKNLRMVERLIRKKADVNAADEAKLTPLMVAANYEGPEYLEMVKLLIRAGARVNDSDELGMTPLMKASMNHYKTDTVRFLLANGAQIEAKDNQGQTALMIACKSARAEVAQFLIQSGADIQAKTTAGESVLTVAKRAGYANVIQLLMKAGARE